MRDGFELGIPEFVIRSDLDEGAFIARLIAVMRRGEDGDTTAVVLDFVALHADLVRADDGLEVVFLAEALGDVRTELQADAALGGAATGQRLGIGPEHLHHEAGLAWLALLEAVQLAHVVESDVVI